MRQKTTLSQGIDSASEKERYDACCKKILAEKIILAWIMKHTMREYEQYEATEIAEKVIRGAPEIANVAVMPDVHYSPKVEGTGVEDGSIAEGTVTYDIRFRAIVPDTGKRVHMIINVEAQNDFYPGYPIIKRGIYYCGRMISSQYGTVFENSHYEKIQKVYTVRICMNPPVSRQNTITQYSIKKDNIVGVLEEPKENYDLLTAIMICLGQGRDNGLLGMLNVLLSSDIKAQEKKLILEDKYGIPMTVEMEGEMNTMCNLSDGVEQKGIEQAQRVIVINMLHLGKNTKEICECVGCDEEYVRKIETTVFS
ncbi:MAG: hypothetical protein IKB01_01535 [Lachnospiraceae bacterium]|nr:hypothetical protein [Lachnospiraceae bacterium]